MEGPLRGAVGAPLRSTSFAVAFTLCLAPILLGAGLWIALGPVDPSRPLAWIAGALATLGWWAALAFARGVPDSFAVAVVLAAGALALRAGFLVSEGELSDDVNRYVWEGALLAEGLAPDAHAPAAPELGAERARWSELFAQVNHPEVAAAYPALAQVLHAAVVTAAGGAEQAERARLGLRFLYGSADLLACLPLALLLRSRRRPLAWLAAWAWNPWVAQEFAGAAHLDALALLCALTALACVPPRGRVGATRAALAGACLAAGTLVKLLPAALLPFVLRRTRRPGSGALGFLLALALGLLPFVLLTGALPGLGGLGEYAFRWESFNLVHRWIEALFARVFDYDEAWSDPRRLARLLLAGAWIALGVVAWRRRLAPARAAAWLVTGFVVLTPTLHPWYLAWIVPFLALRPSLTVAVLLGLAPLLYLPLGRWRVERVWVEPVWFHPLVVALLAVLLALEFVVRRRARP